MKQFIQNLPVLNAAELKLINKYIQEKENQISKENINPKKNTTRKLTNIGCFRAYIKKYLESMELKKSKVA